MDRKEFGQLVAGLRQEQIDEDWQPLSQKKLGEITNLGEITIGKIERGQRVNLTQSDLVLLADALYLTTGERREFFLASSGISEQHLPREVPNDSQVFNEFLEVLYSLQQPAFISDEYYDALVLNKTIMQLWQMPIEFLREKFEISPNSNVMRFFFSPEFSKQQQLMGRAWQRMAHYNLRRFRSHTLRFRGQGSDSYYRQLIKELSSYQKFRQHWLSTYFSEDDYHVDGMKFDIEIEQKEFTFIFTSMKAYTTKGMLELYVYSPISPQTSQLFQSLFQNAGPGYCQIKTWPDKELTNLFRN